MFTWFDDIFWVLKIRIIDPLFKWLGYEPIGFNPPTQGMVRFEENNIRYVTISQIIVPTTFDKEQLLLAFKYLHDNPLIDNDLMAVNAIVHTYNIPELIIVSSEE